MKYITLGFVFLLACFSSWAQKVYYAMPERVNAQNLSFEIIGKYNQTYLIYKHLRNSYVITVYDPEMNVKKEVPLDFIPERLIDISCFSVADGVIFLYQHHQKNMVYCMGARVNAEGLLTSTPSIIDTAVITSYTNDKKIFSYFLSDDKKQLVVLKTKNPFRDEYNFTAKRLNAALELQRTVSFSYFIDSEKETIGEFALDNAGSFLFVHLPRATQRDLGSSVNLCMLPSDEDSLRIFPVRLGKVFPDEMRIKIDNYNRRYILTSFYAHSRRGNIQGLIYLTFSRDSMRLLQQRFFEFTDELKNVAKGENSMNAAFDDYYLKHFLIKKDGSIIITAESSYTNNRNMNMNRWDYPYSWGWGMGSGLYGWGSPFSPWGWGMPGGWNSFGSPSVRYFSDDVVLFSIDKEAGMEWNNVMKKAQFDDNSDDLLSYQTMNTGKEIVLLYNEWTRRSPVLTAQILNAEGKLDRQQPLRNMDKGYEFVIRRGKQVGAREMIVPAFFRNSVSFARLEF
jgi:hypothetical protein